MFKNIVFATIPAIAVVATYAAAAQVTPNLAGTFRCGPNAKACEWSGATFTVTQKGNALDIKNDKGAIGTATITSPISISAGPPWNMLGTISGDARTIEWSNDTQWMKQ
jgi:hypothetical protein